MLISVMFALAFAAAVGLCIGTGAFDTLAFLWQLPVGFVGAFILLVLLAFVALLVICFCIDPEKPRDKDSPWFRKLVLNYIHAILTILPVKIRTTGLEKIPADGRFVLVSNHLHEIDPAFFLHCFPKKEMAFIAKQETKKMPIVNKALPKLLCQPINRENDKEALKTIIKCIQLLKNNTVSIGIFPEGRINAYRKLAHFRPGVFKVAQKANVPIVVCTIQNTNHVIPRLLKGKGAAVDLHLLDVIPAEEVTSQSTVELADRIYAMMAADLGPENVLTPEEEENA